MKKLIGMAAVALFVSTAAFAQVPQQSTTTPQNNFPQTSPNPATSPQPSPAATPQPFPQQQNQSVTSPQQPMQNQFPQQNNQTMTPKTETQGAFPAHPATPADTLIPQPADTSVIPADTAAPAQTDTLAAPPANTDTSTKTEPPTR